MRILFPIGSFYPAQSGGPNNSIYWLSKMLIKSDHDVYIITTNQGINVSHNIKLNKWLLSESINVIYCKTHVHYFPLRFIIESLKKIKYVDIIHLTSVFYPPSLIIAILGVLQNKKILWSTRGELNSQALIYNKYVKEIYLNIIKIISKRITFHVTSEDERDYVKNKLNDISIVLLPNYFELPGLLNTEYKKQFLYIGRISPIKALENLILALPISNHFIKSEYSLIIAGTFENNEKWYYEKLLKLITDNSLNEKIKFVGHIVGKDKQLLYAESYFTILPSHSENFGNVVLESLVQGTPVIASKSVPWKILEGTNSGFWVDNDSETISKYIDLVISIPCGEYNQMRLNAIKLAQKYDIGKNISNWIENYNKVINNEFI
jgi:glycosyltransferase involved in cell wall biosynthesis